MANAKPKAVQSSSCKYMAMAVTEVPIYFFTYYWKIKDFQRLPHGSGVCMTSTHFSTCREDESGNREECKDLKWGLELYPRGCLTETKNHVSLFLTLVENERGESIETTYTFSIGKDLESMVMVKEPSTDMFTTRAVNSIDSDGDSSAWGYECFLHNKTDEMSHLLEQNEFWISCELSHSSSVKDIHANPTSSNIDAGLLRNEGLMSDLLMQMYDRKELTDAVIEVGNSRIHVHKVVLAAKSSVFKKLFESGFAEASTNIIEISDIDNRTCEMMVKYIYGKHDLPLRLGMARVEQLLHAAEKYELSGLKLRCCEILQKNVSSSTVFELLVMSDRYRAEELKTHCMQYVMRHRQEVTSSDAWAAMAQNHPQLLADCIKLG